MIRSVITNEMLRLITAIERNRWQVSDMILPSMVMNRLRKNSKKKSSFASNRIEGNPLSEEQAYMAIESDSHRHFLKPEMEVRNYFLAISYLDECLKAGRKLSRDLILQVQAMVEKGASKEKIGLRGPMPPGFLFAVYDSEIGSAEYIPPQYEDIPGLIDELVEYVNTTDDHPLIVAAIVHYQLVTIHPFEDGNGRTARLISGYVLDYNGFAFHGIGSLEEYFAYDRDEYYRSLQMGLPALYYEGRENPPNPEIWLTYFLRMVELYSSGVLALSRKHSKDTLNASLSFLNRKERELLSFLLKKNCTEFTPVEISRTLGVTNRTVINRTVRLVNNGFVVPVLMKERIRSYALTEYALVNRKEILEYCAPDR